MDVSSTINTNTLQQISALSPSVAPVAEARASAPVEDTFRLSDRASRFISQEQKKNTSDKTELPETGSKSEPSDKLGQTRSSSPEGELTEAEQLEVEELRRRDAEVKAHEQAHTAAAGNLAQSGASFDYETGPDGKRYAVGGEVSIDTSAVAGDPQATLLKAQKIRRAASAPADPSSQDRSVAAQASRMEAEARIEVAELSREQQTEYINEHTTDVDYLDSQQEQSEKNIQDTYAKIQNSSLLQEQKSFVDFFI